MVNVNVLPGSFDRPWYKKWCDGRTFCQKLGLNCVYRCVLKSRKFTVVSGYNDLCNSRPETEAMTLADRIVIMSAIKTQLVQSTIGRVEQIGTPQEVYKNPVVRFVAGFIQALLWTSLTWNWKVDTHRCQWIELALRSSRRCWSLERKRLWW